MINNDRIRPLWNNGGNSFKTHAGFSKFPIIIRAPDKPSAKLTIRHILPVGGDSGRFFRKLIVTVG